MTSRETAADIDEAAARWAARIDRGLMTTEEAELAIWLAADIRREGALVRAEAAWLHAERAASLGAIPVTPAPPALDLTSINTAMERRAQRSLWTRRAALVGGGAMAASLASALLLPRVTPPSEQMFSTGPGQIGQLALADGTRMVLDTATRVAAGIGPEGYHIRLIGGRALFDLGEQDGRPFAVTARLVPLHGTGLFSIAALAGEPLAIMVERGQVAVDTATDPIRLNAGMMLSLPDGVPLAVATIRRLSADAMREAMQWRSGLLAFTGLTLGQAVAQMNRYGGVPIVVADAALATVPIAGIFRSNDPAGFADAIADSLGVRTTRRSGAIVIGK